MAGSLWWACPSAFPPAGSRCSPPPPHPNPTRLQTLSPQSTKGREVKADKRTTAGDELVVQRLSTDQPHLGVAVAKQREQQVERVRPRRLLEKKYVGERVEGRENEVDVLRRGAHLSSDERHQLHRELWATGGRVSASIVGHRCWLLLPGAPVAAALPDQSSTLAETPAS